jgi:hypothetical protein
MDHAHSRVVQQLMFNRILSHLKLLSVEDVTVTDFDAKTGTVACRLAGVDILVSVRLGRAETTTR